MSEGEEVREGKSVFRSVILLMAVIFVVMAGNIGIYAAQAEKVNGNDTTEMVNPTVTPNPDITTTLTTTPIITPEVTPIVKKGLLKEGNSYHYYINGKMVTNTWKKLKNNYYWFKSNGKAAANGYYKVKGFLIKRHADFPLLKNNHKGQCPKLRQILDSDSLEADIMDEILCAYEGKINDQEYQSIKSKNQKVFGL